MKKLLALLCICCMIFVGCGGSEDSDKRDFFGDKNTEDVKKPDKSATSTPVPTSTPEPTATPEPTSTPVPTEAPVQGEGKLDPEALYAKCSNSIVLVNAGSSIGTGFFMDKNIILTNYHVIEGATELSIERFDGRVANVTHVMGYDEGLDIAVLKVDCIGDPLPFNTHGISIGEKTYAIGNSLGITFTFSDGIVTNKNQRHNDADVILTNTAISQGNSGGPLLNEYGEVMGLTTAYYTDGQNLNIVVEIDQFYLVDISNPVSAAEFIKGAYVSGDSMTENSDATESWETAQEVPIDVPVYGELQGGEVVDYYRIEIPVSATYYFSYFVDATDYMLLGLFDENREALGSFDVEEDGEVDEAYVYLDAGEYYLVAVETEDKEIPEGYYVEYGFMYEFSEYAVEDEDYSADPEIAQFVWLGQTGLGDISSSEEEDYYRVEIENDGYYSIEFTSDDPWYVYLGLMDDTGEVLYAVGEESTGEIFLNADIYYLVVCGDDDLTYRGSYEYAFMMYESDGSQAGSGNYGGNEMCLGGIYGDMYYNGYLDVCMDIPEGWYYKTAEELQELPTTSKELFTDYDWYQIQDFSVASPGNTKAIQVMYQYVDEDVKAVYDELTEEECVDVLLGNMDSMIDGYDSMGLKVDSITKGTATFCGEERTVMVMKGNSLGVNFHMITLTFFHTSDAMVLMTFISTGGNYCQELMDLFW